MSAFEDQVQVHALHDPPTGTLTYIVWDRGTLDAVIIDPVLDFDPATQLVSRTSMARLTDFVSSHGLRVHWVLDTHAHADHLSSSRQLVEVGFAPAWGVGERMHEVFATFKKIFAWPESTRLEDMGVTRFFKDGERIQAGALALEVIFTSGHTPACVTYRVGEFLFTGDALFMPDSGVGRCDCPGGSAVALYESVHERLYAFPDHYQSFTGHDYGPGGRALKFKSSMGEQKASNVHLRLATSAAEFITFRESRDKTLPAPRLLNPSLDWNLGAHQLVKR